MKSTRSPTEFDQDNRDVTSIPGYVIKKNSSRGAKHGPSERQKMYYRAKQMLEKGPPGKARTPPNDTLREHHMMLYDRIAVEKHIYVDTKAERIQNSKRWSQRPQALKSLKR